MKIYKVMDNVSNIKSYVKISDNCNIFDTGYKALQITRKHYNDYNISGTQILSDNEKMINDIPVFTI